MSSRSLNGRDIYRKQANIVARKVAGQLIVVPISGHLASLQRIFALNPVGEYVWSQLDGQATVDDIIERLVQEFEVTADQAKTDASDFISQLAEAGLVERTG